jgi:hypothetical protein
MQMRLQLMRKPGIAMVAVAVLAMALIGPWSGIAVGNPVPTAALSIDPASPALTVEFVAQAQNFPGTVVSYHWIFGDGYSATTTADTVTHTYGSAAVFMPSVTETDTSHNMATATATLSLNVCPAGYSSCTEYLSSIGNIQLLQVTGPVHPGTPAEANLLTGSFGFPGCQPAIEQAVGVTDSGFTGNLTLTLNYTTSNPSIAPTTCFSSTVAFAEVGGTYVLSGPLPACALSYPVAPCVQSVSISGYHVSKQLLIPPGDPKVGAP